jgi:hypothetical protein
MNKDIAVTVRRVLVGLIMTILMFDGYDKDTSYFWASYMVLCALLEGILFNINGGNKK